MTEKLINFLKDAGAMGTNTYQVGGETEVSAKFAKGEERGIPVGNQPGWKIKYVHVGDLLVEIVFEEDSD